MLTTWQSTLRSDYIILNTLQSTCQSDSRYYERLSWQDVCHVKSDIFDEESQCCISFWSPNVTIQITLSHLELTIPLLLQKCKYYSYHNCDKISGLCRVDSCESVKLQWTSSILYIDYFITHKHSTISCSKFSSYSNHKYVMWKENLWPNNIIMYSLYDDKFISYQCSIILLVTNFFSAKATCDKLFNIWRVISVIKWIWYQRPHHVKYPRVWSHTLALASIFNGSVSHFEVINTEVVNLHSLHLLLAIDIIIR